jgi:hypothetical protein
MVEKRVLKPFKAVKEKRTTANGMTKQVGAIPPNKLCHMLFMGAWHVQCGTTLRITVGIKKGTTDLPR